MQQQPQTRYELTSLGRLFWERGYPPDAAPSQPEPMSETATPCRIYEYDGAFKCYAHDRMWGAVTDPDEPCETRPATGRDASSQPEPIEPLVKVAAQRLARLIEIDKRRSTPDEILWIPSALLLELADIVQRIARALDVEL